MLPLQLVLRSERDEGSWPSPPRIHAKKRRNSASSPTRRSQPPRSRTPLILCSVQVPTPKTSPRRRSRSLTVHKRTWRSIERVSSTVLDIPRVCISFCSTLVEAVVSTTTAIAHNIFDAATMVLKTWWGYRDEDGETGLEVVESKPAEQQDLHDILEENDRLKRMLEFAVNSHLIMNEATSMLGEGAELWMKRAEDAVDTKVLEAEQERDELAFQLEGLREQLGDKDKEIGRLRDGFGTDSANLSWLS